MTLNTTNPAATAKADIDDLQYFKNIYHQDYIKSDYKSGEKYRSHDGAAQRAIIEKAMLHTEAYKLSRRGQKEMMALSENDKKNKVEFIFQKYCTFYAYSDESTKYRRGLRDIMNENKEFYQTYITEESRALARQIKIRTLANEIDQGSYKGYGIARFYQQRQGQKL